MITEDYVSFETAKLLKDKGFNEPTLAYTYGDDMIGYYSKPKITDQLCIEAGRIPMPTLQMAMKWLREVHKIHIQIWILEEKGYWFDIEKILNVQYKHKSLYSTGLEDIYFETYEQACEAAIKYCLENLIK